MKVWIVTSREPYAGALFCGVYSTRDKAQESLSTLSDLETYDIDEYEVDAD